MSVAPLAPGCEIAPGHEVIAHERRLASFDLYDVWSRERGARCWVKTTIGGDRPGEHRLLAEGRLLERLAHPHIVRGYETVEAPRPAVVVERLEGPSLEELLEAAGEPLGAREVAHLGLHLGSALHYLHGRGVLHLQLAPGEVVSEGRRAKLIGLGAARPVGRADVTDEASSSEAPELRNGAAPSPAADVWGLGSVLARAAGGDSAGGALSGVLGACLAADPEARPAMQVALAMLESAVVESPSQRRFDSFAAAASAPSGLGAT